MVTGVDMATIALICRWGTPEGSRSLCNTVNVSDTAQLEREARRLLTQCGESRAFVTHYLADGRAYRGYRTAPKEFYGEGLEG